MRVKDFSKFSVAVLFGHKRSVRILRVCDNFLDINSFKVCQEFSLIAATDTEIILCNSGALMYIYSLDGRQLRMIDIRGQTYMCNTIALSEDGNMLYAGHLVGGMIAYNRNRGEVVWQRDSNGTGVRKLCVGVGCRLYGCSNRIQDIVCVDGNTGDNMQVCVPSGDISQTVMAMHYDKYNSRLLWTVADTTTIYATED